MSVITPPSPEVRIRDRLYVTLTDMTYKWRGKKLTVYAGTVTDLASIPRIVRPLFPTISEARAKGAIGHDELFARRRWEDGSPVSLSEANRFMYDVCIAEGMPIYLGLMIRWGLFLGSWWPWYGWRMTWLGPRRRKA